jgi:DNA-binding response OmpR family regulator
MNDLLTHDENIDLVPVTRVGGIPRNRVLVVDSDRLQRTLRGAMLAIAGFATCCVADGDEALEAIDIAPFDLVVIDRKMLRLDGCSLVRVLRARGNNVPVVMVTGSLQDETVPDELRTEIAETLPGTASTRELIGAITRALHWHPSKRGLASFAGDCSPAFGF